MEPDFGHWFCKFFPLTVLEGLSVSQKSPSVLPVQPEDFSFHFANDWGFIGFATVGLGYGGSRCSV